MRAASRVGAALLLLLAAGTAGLSGAELRVTPSAAHVGFFGLEIDVGSDCAFADQVILAAPPATVTGVIEACQEIVASGVTVEGATTLHAGDSVILGEGFTVAAGAELTVVEDPTLSSKFASIRNSSPVAEATYRARFHLLLDDLNLVAGEEVEHFRAEAADGSAVFRLSIRPDPGSPGYFLALSAWENSGWRETAAGEEVAVPQGWNELELDWVAGDGGGHWLVSVNGAPFEGLADLANGSARVDAIRWGALDGAFAGAPGTVRVDGFTSWR